MLQYRNLTMEDLSAVEKLFEEVYAFLPNKRWYFYENDAPRWISSGTALGCFDGGRPVAVAACGADRNRKELSIAKKLGALQGESWDYHDVFISPAYRHQGIFRELCNRVISLSRKDGAKCVYCTIDPDNLPSRRAFEACGFRCLCEKITYDGRPRCFYKLTL